MAMLKRVRGEKAAAATQEMNPIARHLYDTIAPFATQVAGESPMTGTILTVLRRYLKSATEEEMRSVCYGICGLADDLRIRFPEADVPTP